VNDGGVTAVGRPRPGRPPSGARERILGACLEVLKSEGYAGVTIAKIAARAGENKALISYHFGSKQGAIAAAARLLGEIITEEVVASLEGAETPTEVVTGLLDGVWSLLDRDVRFARAYFDLNAVSVVEDDVRSVMRQVKGGFRQVGFEYLRDAGVPAARARTGSTMVIAGAEGLSLEWVERGRTPELDRAKEMFVRAAVSQL
jgi:TetR/AcrR family transcriptional repressor of bet genes